MKHHLFIGSVFILAALLAPGMGPAANATGPKDTLVFTAAPRETPKEGQAIYGPVAAYLSKAIGKKIVYQHPGTWGVYRSEMLKGTYDLVFDGPHFNSYRAEKLGHTILVKVPTPHEFVIIVKKEEKFTAPQQLAGHTVCSHAPPNLGALILLGQFDNPVRQPAIVPTDGWDEIYRGVVSGKCEAGVLPLALLRKYDKDALAKIIYRAKPMPNNAFSAGPRISPEDRTKIEQALLAPEAAGPTAKLRAEFKVGDSFAPASNQEYAGLAEYLKNEWGYY